MSQSPRHPQWSTAFRPGDSGTLIPVTLFPERNPSSRRIPITSPPSNRDSNRIAVRKPVTIKEDRMEALQAPVVKDYRMEARGSPVVKDDRRIPLHQSVLVEPRYVASPLTLLDRDNHQPRMEPHEQEDIVETTPTALDGCYEQAVFTAQQQAERSTVQGSGHPSFDNPSQFADDSLHLPVIQSALVESGDELIVDIGPDLSKDDSASEDDSDLNIETSPTVREGKLFDSHGCEASANQLSVVEKKWSQLKDLMAEYRKEVDREKVLMKDQEEVLHAAEAPHLDDDEFWFTLAMLAVMAVLYLMPKECSCSCGR